MLDVGARLLVLVTAGPQEDRGDVQVPVEVTAVRVVSQVGSVSRASRGDAGAGAGVLEGSTVALAHVVVGNGSLVTCPVVGLCRGSGPAEVCLFVVGTDANVLEVAGTVRRRSSGVVLAP